MTLPRLYALSAYWQKFPPVHISVAAFVGINNEKPKPKKSAEFLELPEYE
jgi:hypothetical protein